MTTLILRSALSLALATLVNAASAAPCATASLASYVALGSAGCSIGGITLSSMAVQAFPGPQAQQIAADGITLAPTAGGFSLSSASALTAAAGQLLGLRIAFDVAAPALVGATVGLGATGSVGGDGTLTGLLDAGSAGTAIAVVVSGFDDRVESFASAARPSYAAAFELGIDGGTAGSARLGPLLATLAFATPVPEPGVAWLLGAGLAGLAGLRAGSRRR